MKRVTEQFIGDFHSQVHDEREMDRVLGIEGVELIGINNRNLGKYF